MGIASEQQTPQRVSSAGSLFSGLDPKEETDNRDNQRYCCYNDHPLAEGFILHGPHLLSPQMAAVRPPKAQIV